MENKKNSKKTVKLLVVLIALLLIACSLLGFTLARYITQGNEGTGGADIAQWNIYDDDDEDAPSGEGSVRAMLSPAMAAYSTGQRTNTVANAGTTGFRITNKSDVVASVTLTLTNGIAFYSNTADVDGTYPVVTDENTPNDADNNPEWQNVDLDDIIHFANGDSTTYTVQVYDAKGVQQEAPTETTEGITLNGVAATQYTFDLAAEGGYVDVLIGQITWTSDLATENAESKHNGFQYGDLRDTWIGENVGSVGFAYSWIAEQASQVPDGGVSEPTP